MNLQEIVSHAKNLLRQSVKPTLNYMLPLINPECEIFDDLIHVEGRYNQIEGEFNRGVISSNEQGLKLNQIRESVLNTINHLKESHIKYLLSDNGENDYNASNKMLEKLREYISEIEKLRAENQILKKSSKKHKLKIIIQCEPEIQDKPNNYTCHCVILDDNTGEYMEKEVPLRKEPGGIIATIHDINPSDYVQIKIKGKENVWESEYFSPQFLTQILRIV